MNRTTSRNAPPSFQTDSKSSRHAHAFLALACLLIASPVIAGTPDPNGAVAAMQAVPFKYNNGILQVRGKAGNPNPSQWEIIARPRDEGGTIAKLTIEDAQFVGETPSFNMGQMFRDAGYIFIPEIMVDSGTAFAKAHAEAAKAGLELAAADYLLERHGDDVDPAWSLTCYDTRGHKIGTISILATTGLVTVETGFRP